MARKQAFIDIRLRPGIFTSFTAVAPITAKHDVIHKTGSTQRSAMSPAEDRATATGDLHIKFCMDRSSGSRDMLAHRQTDRRTDRWVDHNTPHPYRGRV